MYKLGILSRDAVAYKNALETKISGQVSITEVAATPSQMGDVSQLDILLAEPDLAAEILVSCSNLKWLQSTWAGVTPLVNMSHGDYVISGVKDIFGKQMREYVLAYMLYFSRNIGQFNQQKNTHQWSAPDTSHLYGKTLGIMGVGSIGQEVAKATKAFDMQVAGLTASSRNCPYVDKYFSIEEKHEFARDLDYLICLLPHTHATEGLIDTSLLAALPAHCVLINAGRGQVIDDNALLAALKARRLKAAVLDVFDTEPLPPEHPYWHSEHVHITHHSAAISKVSDITGIFLDNYERFCAKEALNYEIDVSRGY